MEHRTTFFALAMILISSLAGATAQQFSSSCGMTCESTRDCSGGLVCNPISKTCDGDPSASTLSCPIPGCEPAQTFVYSNATAHNPALCFDNTTYQFFNCSPQEQPRNFAAFYFIELEESPTSCNRSTPPRNSELLASMSTGWFANGSSCHREIVITAENGLSVTATVIDQCGSNIGCTADTGFYGPCSPRSLGGTRAVWEALGQTYFDNVLAVTWSWKREDSSTRDRNIAIAVVSSGAIVVLALLGLVWWKFLRRSSDAAVRERPLDLGNLADLPRQFRYQEVYRATKGFQSKVGQGGFASVFKGTLPGGEIVAVKRIGGGVRQRDKQFKAEVMSIGSIHHLNLVKMVGFCLHSPQNLLVYEFLPNGSLDSWIFAKDSSLPWASRLSIALDVARGLAYLHEGCREKILHLDIKPQNILLDEKMGAKIADFGFSKLIDKDESHVVTVMRGTVGYMAPEWLHSRVTDKTDVYSFGVVLLELVCGMKAVECSSGSGSQMDVVFLGQTAFNKLDSGNSMDLVDDRLLKAEDGGAFSLTGFENILRIGLWCTQEDPLQRPTMSVVVKMLEGAMDVLAFPQLERPAAQSSPLLASSGQFSISVSGRDRLNFRSSDGAR
ncbi:G-type lectin S-receptor-like serine/threonine-protein kinase SD2-5 [Selaginella moellendorffii]|nr:G-type lectin S-receptor-like serine/threonine-protein kinase SD2-5 [Selaginella moellendorffii]|eukprot:XP_024528945.1 G-type lectin S-receptor-like serine/threonine-protein kinase SD2-5 [Selaginella moellendorffii]